MQTAVLCSVGGPRVFPRQILRFLKVLVAFAICLRLFAMFAIWSAISDSSNVIPSHITLSFSVAALA